MYATSNSARAPAARILAAVWTELPSTYFTVAPVAFSKAAAWHFFELSTKVPPNVATTSSSADAGSARVAVRRHVNKDCAEWSWSVVPPGASGGAIIRQPRRASQPILFEPDWIRERVAG